MLNFYNYFRKIHPELANRLEEFDRKMNLLPQATNDTLIIRVSRNRYIDDDNLSAKGEVIFTNSFGANDTIELSEEQTLSVITDVKVIMIYYNYDCTVLYKTRSNANVLTAYFGEGDDGISVENNTLTRILPS